MNELITAFHLNEYIHAIWFAYGIVLITLSGYYVMNQQLSKDKRCDQPDGEN